MTGSPVKHSIITPLCRANRTEMGAFDEAVRLARAEYLACLPGNPTANFHLVLSVERVPVDQPAVSQCSKQMNTGEYAPMSEEGRGGTTPAAEGSPAGPSSAPVDQPAGEQT